METTDLTRTSRHSVGFHLHLVVLPLLLLGDWEGFRSGWLPNGLKWRLFHSDNLPMGLLLELQSALTGLIVVLAWEGQDIASCPPRRQLAFPMKSPGSSVSWCWLIAVVTLGAGP